MLKNLRAIIKQRNVFLDLLVGVPSYDKYVTYMQSHHPEELIKTRKDFFCEAQEARYNAKGGKVSRCC